MKLPKFLLLLFCVTLLSLTYVWQQTEIFRLAYAGQKNVNSYQELLDKNTVLKYNIDKEGSLIRIGNQVPASGEFELPESFRLVRLKVSQTKIVSYQARKQENLFARLFAIKQQAEAKTINP